MKKTIKLLQLIFSFSCILLFASCRNSFGENTEEKTLIFTGSFEVENYLLRRMENKSYTGNDLSRSAQPSLPASLTYYAKATNKNNSSDYVESSDLNSTSKTFSIPLKTGATWIIEVGAKGVSALDSLVDNAVLIKDTFEFNPATAAEPRTNHKFYLVPYVSENGEGYIDLGIQIENPKGNKISRVEIVPKRDLSDESKNTTEWNSVNGWTWNNGILSFNSTSVLDTNSTATVPIQKNNFPSGVWEVAINFTDEDGQLLFSSTQIIGVYDNLKTNKWESSKTTASSNELIKNGIFKLTTQLIDSYGLTDFYVDGHYIEPGIEDTATGSPNKPFATISKAISVVNGLNRLDKTYTIHVKDGISENYNAELLIQANISIECYKEFYGDKKGSATITSTSSASIIKIESDAGSPVLTIEGIKDGNGWTGLKLKSESATGRASTNTTRGVRITENCSFYMNGGEISGNRLTSGNGAGVYVEGNSYFTMGGGIITNNTTNGNGGGIYVAENGDFTMKGGSIIGNEAQAGGGAYISGFMTIGGTVNISGNTKTATSVTSNVYLPTGKLIKINGKLQSSDTNQSSIGISTQTLPTVGTNIRFTDGYAYGKVWSQNKNDDGTYNHPFKYFHSDVTGYSILTDPTPEDPNTPEHENNGDAYLGISGGTITQYTVPEETILFSFYEQSNKIKITITCTDTEWSGSESSNTHIFLKKNGAEIPESFWSHTYTANNEIEVTLGDTLPAGSYVIEIDVSYGSYVYTGICRCTK